MARKTLDDILREVRDLPPGHSLPVPKLVALGVVLPDDCFRFDAGDVSVITRRSAASQGTYDAERTRRRVAGTSRARFLREVQRHGQRVAVFQCPCGETIEDDPLDPIEFCATCTHPLEVAPEAPPRKRSGLYQRTAAPVSKPKAG